MFKRMLLCLLALILLVSSARADAPLRVVANGGWADMDLLSYLPIELKEVDDVIAEIANAFMAQNDQIDIFIFPADQGLYTVKKHGYYAPLNTSKLLTERLGDFYPAVQRALTTEDGELAAWVLGAGVMGMTIYQTTVLEDNGLTPPTTFWELLDCCQAILEADALPMDTSLLSDHPYTRQSVLNLYMDQYIRASQLEGGTVDFMNPDFVATVERINAELPDNDQRFVNGMADQAVFNYPVGFTAIDKDMLPMPQVLPDKAGLIDTYLSVVVVNPYSKRRKAAIKMLEFYMTSYRVPTFIYDASLDQAVRRKNVSISVEDLEADIAKLEALEELTVDQQMELEELRALYDTCWMISWDDIAAYNARSGGMSIPEASPVSYDEALQTAAKRYISGAYDAAGFAKACQDHVDMIYLENGILKN